MELSFIWFFHFHRKDFMNQVSLCYREGSSDKVYQAFIEPKDDKFVVNFAFGRRASTLNTGTQTAVPVDFDQATKILTKLVNEKKAKGCTEGEHGTPYQQTDKEDQISGLLPQLLNPIDEDQTQQLIADSAWCMQEKKDGKRILLQKKGAAIHGINRRGLFVGLPSPIIYSAQKIVGDFILDGECVGDVLHVFDVLQADGLPVGVKAYRERLMLLTELVDQPDVAHIDLVETSFSIAEKIEVFARLNPERKEGVVFKRLDAPYTPGRPSNGGSQLKHKFYATASFVVGAVSSKRSVSLSLHGPTGLVSAGNVTIPANHAVPNAGAIVEVRCLDAFKESGSVYQPTYLGVREDIDPAHCTVDQLKYRANNEDDES